MQTFYCTEGDVRIVINNKTETVVVPHRYDEFPDGVEYSTVAEV